MNLTELIKIYKSRIQFLENYNYQDLNLTQLANKIDKVARIHELKCVIQDLEEILNG